MVDSSTPSSAGRSTPAGLPRVSLDGFDSLEPIGSGGYSRVYRARQVGFGREVALKVLAVGIETEAQQQSFERECRAMGVLSQHPHIVTVFNAAFTRDRLPCIVMEFYAGGTLGDRVRRSGALPLADLLSVGIQISGALQAAHDRGVVHRDIKPQNLFVSEYGQPALGDFGISSFDDERTATGGGAGLTVHYAPPELIEGEMSTARSDVYSLAATLFTLATGRRPYPRHEGQSVGELARRILFEPAPRVPREYGSDRLSEALSIAMAKDPNARPGSAAEFGRELQEIQASLGLAVTPMTLAPQSLAPQSLAPGRPTTEGGSVKGEVVGASGSEAGPADPASSSLHPVSAALHPDSTGGRSRWFRALAACGLILFVLAVVALLPGAEEPNTAPTLRAASPSTTDDFFAAPAVPRDIVIGSSPDGSSADVSWSDPGGAERYQILRVDTGEIIEVSETRLRLSLNDKERPCVEVSAVGEGGKLSAPSEAVCLP